MDGLTLSATTTGSSFSAIQCFPQSSFHFRNSRILSFPYRKPRNISVSASKDDSKLDEWDQMELKFGRMIGEDPKITLAKIMGRKSNPEISYLEIEKLLEQKKGKSLNEEIEEIPFDVSDEQTTTKSVQGLNLVRPVPKKGTKFETSNTKPVKSDTKSYSAPITKPTKETKSSIPDVILRKPSSFYSDDDGNGKSSRIEMKPNLSLKMGKEPQKERFSDITLLKKPQAMTDKSGDENDLTDSSDGMGYSGRSDASIVLNKPEMRTENNLDVSNSDNQLFQENMQTESGQGSETELQASDGPSQDTSIENVLIGKPIRLDRPSKPTDQKTREDSIPVNRENLANPVELEKFLTSLPIKEREEDDWARAEELVKTGGRVGVELISSSTRGFVVSFGSLIGFIPYRNLAAKWKFLAFESWLRNNGLDPSMYRQNLGIVGKYEATSTTDVSESIVESESGSESDGKITSDMKLEDLLMTYDQEKHKFLSSFLGQRVKVVAVLADRNSRRLIFSMKPKEKEESVEKKRNLMARLSVGDVVKCCIKKITYFGVFVEVEGVPALIHQTEVSWDATLDPESYFKVGQMVDAKVHQLDFSLERIFLSLKEITPDPMTEALEAVVGDPGSLDGKLEAAEADTEWPDVESLMKELQQFDGIQSVSKGRYFLSPGLAPTFQVYMASMFENQYKLLARSGNRVQEVIVETDLGKEELKSAILTCTNRVE